MQWGAICMRDAGIVEAVRTPVGRRDGLLAGFHPVALEHPLGATGARLMATLIHALERTGGCFGLQTMCCGGGLGIATVLQRESA
jgi:acetyl-CoA acetyltransferase